MNSSMVTALLLTPALVRVTTSPGASSPPSMQWIREPERKDVGASFCQPHVVPQYAPFYEPKV